MSFPLYISNRFWKLSSCEKTTLAHMERGEIEGKKKSFCLQLWHACKSTFQVAGAAVLVYTVLLYLLFLISSVSG